MKNPEDDEVDTKIYRTALEAAKRKFSPEFMNRIDKVVVFRALKERHLRRILDIELAAVQARITESAGTKFVFECNEPAKEFLLQEGIDLKYGARHLKRSIERFLVYPLSNLVATQQVETGDLVLVDFDADEEKLTFAKKSGQIILSEPEIELDDDIERDAKSDAVGMPLPEPAAVTEKTKTTSESEEEVS